MNDPVLSQTLDLRGTSEPSFLRVDGVDVAYRRAGSGEPVVFLHGMGLANSWLESHDDLSQHFDLIAPQMPGFGRTPRPAWYRSIDDFAPLVIDFLNALGVDKFHLIGHSLGGLVAGTLGATYPERLLSLTIVAPLPLPVVRDPELEGNHDGPAPANLMSLLFNDNHAAYSEYDPPEDLGLYVTDADDAYSDPGAFSLDPTPSLYRRLARITVPAQVIVPDEDRVVPHPDVFKDWGKWLNAPLVRVSSDKETTGHMLTIQESKVFTDTVVKFIESASRA